MLFEPPFGGLKGNVHTPSIPRWKARGQLPTCHNSTLLLSLMVETLQAEICRSRHVLKGWFTLSAVGRGRRPPTTVGVRKL